jgi:hypothetical protein
MTTATAPKQAAGASYLAALMAVLLIGVGAVGVRDALLGAGVIDGSAWIPAVLRLFDGLVAGSWLLPVGVVALVLGLFCVVLALKPRRRRTVDVDADSAVYLDVREVARIASAAAETVSGVLKANSSATRRRVSVRCLVTGPVSREVIEQAIGSELAALTHPVRIRVKTRTEATT